jgi:hypothetical protein
VIVATASSTALKPNTRWKIFTSNIFGNWWPIVWSFSEAALITKFVVAPCHNCFDQVNDLSEAYILGVKALSLKEIICEIMIVPDKFKLDRQENDHHTRSQS